MNLEASRKKALTSDYILFGVLALCFLSLGVLGHMIYQDITNKKAFEGLRFEGNYTHPEALGVANKYGRGDWVCVRTDGMSYKRALEVCAHEVGHEIFAEYCEGNIDKCINITKDLNSSSNISNG